MRHFVSLVIGLVAAPLVWLVVGFGQLLVFDVLRRYAQGDPLQLVGPFALLVAAGIVYGLVATTRISPVGPIVGGLLFVAGQVLLTIFPSLLGRMLSFEVFGIHAGHAVTQPAYSGMLMVLGVGLLMATFSFGRWRTPAKGGPPPPPYGFGGPVPGAPTPAGAQQPFGSADDAPTTMFPPVGAQGSAPSPVSPPGVTSGPPGPGVTSGPPGPSAAAGDPAAWPGAAGGPPAGWPDPHLAQRPATSQQPDHDSERTARLPRSGEAAPPSHPGS